MDQADKSGAPLLRHPVSPAGYEDEIKRAKQGEGGGVAAKSLSVVVCALLIGGLVATNLLSNVVAAELLKGGAGTAQVTPLFMIYFNVSWDMCCFAFLWCLRRYGARSGATAAAAAAGAVGNYPPRYVAHCGAWLCAVYQLGNWLYFVGLSRVSVTVSMIIYQTSSLWVLLLSVSPLLGDRFCWRRAGSVAVCLCGVSLVALDYMSAASAGRSSQLRGSLAMLGSGVLWALYEVLQKAWLPNANTADALAFVGCRGAANALLMWPALVGASAAGHSVWPAAAAAGAHYAWGGLTLMALISVGATLLITLGIAWTSPLFVRVGSMLSVPCGILFLEVAWHRYRPGWPCWAGALWIMAGFWLLPPSSSSSDSSSSDEGGEGGGDGGGGGGGGGGGSSSGSRCSRHCLADALRSDRQNAVHRKWLTVGMIALGGGLIAARAVAGNDRV